MDKTHHLLYRVTNTKNRKEYIGVHSTNNIYDGYMGSGTLLKKDIMSFGVHVFTREIIDVFETRKDLLVAESILVDAEYLKTANTYNIVYGGGGVRTTKEKRRLFTKSIYSKDANELKVKTEKFSKYNSDFQYIFDFSKAEILKPNYKRGVLAEKVMDFIINNWMQVEQDITLLWNNLYTNDVAKKFILKLMNYKGVYGKIYIDLFDWDGNFIRKEPLIVE